METRIALASCVVFASALCGRAAADAVRRRATTLEALAQGLRALRIHMMDMLEPVQRALERSDCALFNRVCEGMKSGVSAAEAWKAIRRAASRRGGPADALIAADLKALDGLFEHLGQSGPEEQEAMLASALSTLEDLRVSARKRAGEAERLYASLGLLIGLMMALIVI